MSPRIAYWTSAFDPDIEAVSSEIALLRDYFSNSIAWGLNPRHRFLFSQRRGYCIHPNMHLLFRTVTSLLEPCFQINHVFGSLGDWYYLQGNKSRPTILTIAVTANPVEKTLLDRIDLYVVEYPSALDDLKRLGISSERVNLVFPPVDLHRFKPKPVNNEKFIALFASSPDRADWLDARGVLAILDAAAQKPEICFRLLWRPWGDSLPKIKEILNNKSLVNVELSVGKVNEMELEYQSASVVLTPFRDIYFCKPSPNSLVEGLACGRPVICSSQVGLASLVEEFKAGVVCDPSGESIANAIDICKENWESMSINGRKLAETHFDKAQFIEAYRSIYEKILN